MDQFLLSFPKGSLDFSDRCKSYLDYISNLDYEKYINPDDEAWDEEYYSESQKEL